MAGELWNRVHIPRPGAISVFRVHFDSNTGTVRQSNAYRLNMLVLLRSVELKLYVKDAVRIGYMPFETHVGRHGSSIGSVDVLYH